MADVKHWIWARRPQALLDDFEAPAGAVVAWAGEGPAIGPIVLEGGRHCIMARGVVLDIDRHIIRVAPGHDIDRPNHRWKALDRAREGAS